MAPCQEATLQIQRLDVVFARELGGEFPASISDGAIDDYSSAGWHSPAEFVGEFSSGHGPWQHGNRLFFGLAHVHKDEIAVSQGIEQFPSGNLRYSQSPGRPIVFEADFLFQPV